LSRTVTRPTIEKLGIETSPLPTAKARQRLAQAFVAELKEGWLGWRPPRDLEVSGVAAKLPFAPALRVVELTLTRNGKALPKLFLLESNEQVVMLDGSSATLYAGNDHNGTEVTAVTAATYLRYFHLFVRNNARRPFTLVEAVVRGASAIDEEAAAKAAAHARPVEFLGRNGDENFVIGACVHHRGVLFETIYAVTPHGRVPILEDKAVELDVPETVVDVPPTLYSAACFAEQVGGRPRARLQVLR
jgi:hypothetical protein